ncbi:MAG: hypothetical protein P8R42_10505 [Candidatus Binatia bacterium]|nr:hypothetical protein [Candidatus Binatia bacterium]
MAAAKGLAVEEAGLAKADAKLAKAGRKADAKGDCVATVAWATN